jgi:AcrR family transcriptional regulator
MVIRRPGGRTARTRAAVIQATLALLSERGPAEIGMADIADRAGVAATSLYRRWGSLDRLLLDAAMERLRVSKPLPDTGSIEGDLRTWALAIASGLKNPGRSLAFKVIVAAAARMESGREETQKALNPRVSEIREMLERARLRGEAVPALTAVVDYLLAPLYTRALFGMKIENDLAERLVRRLMDDVS